MKVSIGVDVGGTTIASGLVADNGDVLWAMALPTHKAGPGTAMAAMLEVVDAAVAESRRRGLSVEAIGAGFPGAVDVEHGVMVGDEHLVPELNGLPLREHLAARAGVPAFVDNDVNALALGEARFGIGRGTRSMVVVAVGTEIGGGIIVDGMVLRGAHGYAGEIGHLPINFDGPDCAVCGGRGCLGLYLGGRRLAEEARRRVAGGATTGLQVLAGGDPAAITSTLVFAAAVAGDPLAAALVEEAAEALGATIGLLVNLVNPELIVITGGVAGSLVPLERDLLRRAGRYAFPRPFRQTRVRIVPGDKTLTVQGGAALTLYEIDRARRAAGGRLVATAGET